MIVDAIVQHTVDHGGELVVHGCEGDPTEVFLRYNKTHINEAVLLSIMRKVCCRPEHGECEPHRVISFCHLEPISIYGKVLLNLLSLLSYWGYKLWLPAAGTRGSTEICCCKCWISLTMGWFIYFSRHLRYMGARFPDTRQPCRVPSWRNYLLKRLSSHQRDCSSIQTVLIKPSH